MILTDFLFVYNLFDLRSVFEKLYRSGSETGLVIIKYNDSGLESGLVIGKCNDSGLETGLVIGKCNDVAKKLWINIVAFYEARSEL